MNPKGDLDKAITYLQMYKLDGCRNDAYFNLAIDYLRRHKKARRSANQTSA